MGTRPRRPVSMPTRRKASSAKNRRSSCRRTQKRTTTSCSVSDKLEALKNLLPANNIDEGAGNIRADKLFQETADYILLLRTQVSVLQKLVEFYGSPSNSAAMDTTTTTSSDQPNPQPSQNNNVVQQ